MSGLEVVGGIAACIALTKTLKSCLEFLLEIREGLSRDKDPLIFCLLLEEAKFRRWCEAVGASGMIKVVAADPQHWRDTDAWKLFQRNLEKTLRLDNEQIATITLRIVEAMEARFRGARRKLRSAELPLTVVEEEKRRKWTFRQSFFNATDRSRLPPSVGEKHDTDSAKPSQIGSSIIAGTRWIISDKKAFREQLKDIEDLNRQLASLMPTKIQNHLERLKQIDLLQPEANAHAMAIDLSGNSEMRTMANIKTERVQFSKAEEKETVTGVEASISSGKEAHTITQSSSNSSPLTFVSDDCTENVFDLDPIRAHTTLGKLPVMIEWKYYSRSHSLRLHKIFRLYRLLCMLESHDLYRKFHTLLCIGLLQDEASSRIGLVFKPPKHEHSQKLKNVSLQDLIRTSYAAPLGDRFKLAQDLAVAVLQLISVTWLHGSFRSDNIISVRPAKLVNDKPCQTTSSRVCHLPDFFIMGWDLSRPDQASDIAESRTMTVNGYRAKKYNTELYSHPEMRESLSEGPPRIFKTEYDLYGLGLVLLEIGLWRTLHSMREEYGPDTDFHVKILTDLVNKLPSRMGDTYWQATRRCLMNDFDLNLEGGSSGSEGRALQIAFEDQVVHQLAKCSA
ncbi:hypothetical protein MMC10_005798 [Thelotrema lepadinum]|nr:hypothetical protein [Thelotrema lepadinum]